jgi:ribosomal protein S9
MLEIEKKYDVIIESKGGGILGQVDAIKSKYLFVKNIKVF